MNYEPDLEFIVEGMYSGPTQSIEQLKYMNKYINDRVGKEHGMSEKSPAAVWSFVTSKISDPEELKKIANYIYNIEKYMYKTEPSPLVSGSIMKKEDARAFIEK